jgi:multiple sugar transport system ATP-binding protein
VAEIRVENLRKAFGSFEAVKSSTFAVSDGEFCCLLGPSGCGKTTTLRMIAGLELPTEGRILLGGDDVTFKRASERDIAMVFQLFALYPHMNVRRNIAYPLANVGMSKPEIIRRVEEAARILQITHLLDRSVSGLSGGDRQRVALGRAIVREPKAFMMDEPLGALDSEFREVMCRELRALHNRLKATTVYVTHDQLEAMAMADKIAVMNKGVIEQYAAPQEVYDRPATLFVADFIGSPAMNLIEVRGPLPAGTQEVTLPGGGQRIPALREAAGSQPYLLGVRPEHLQLADEGPVRGEIFAIEYLGTTQIVTVKTDVGTVRARMPSDVRVNERERVALRLAPDKLSIFDRASGRVLKSALHDMAGAARG